VVGSRRPRGAKHSKLRASFGRFEFKKRLFGYFGAAIGADSVPVVCSGISRERLTLAADPEGLTFVQTAGKISLILQCGWLDVWRSAFRARARKRLLAG